ncbi:MAG: response regulator [Leptolyngbyaceae cyanobacterium CSU_1_4]|nr:response regulator [Leptolyngbyaceae cyanobacterium CSU_1_4]
MSTVLIVDDSHTLRQMIAEILQSNGLVVIEAINGVEAKGKIQSEAPDLVITDLIMPLMNGYELCRWIKTDPHTQNIPVLMCSTKSEEFDRYWGMKQGADAYMTKPFHPQDLVKAVKQLLKTRGKLLS